MIANKLPSVLYQPHGNSLSVERVLRSAQQLIERHVPPEHADDHLATVIYDDLEVLIRNLE